MRDFLARAGAVALGILAGCLLWWLLLGIQIQRHEPGLWTLRVSRVVACGLDYNGPPFTHGDRNLWVTCGGDDQSWRLWPLR